MVARASVTEAQQPSIGVKVERQTYYKGRRRGLAVEGSTWIIGGRFYFSVRNTENPQSAGHCSLRAAYTRDCERILIGGKRTCLCQEYMNFFLLASKS